MRFLTICHSAVNSTKMYRLIRPVVLRQCKRFYTPIPRVSRLPRRPPPRLRQRVVPNEVYYPQTGSSLITPHDPITDILSHHTLVIERRIEMMNVFLGFEQANRYIIMDTNGNQLGYMIERDIGIMKMIMRQVYRLHRPFTVDVFDNNGNLLMTIKRPFSFINSRIQSILPGFQNVKDDGVVIGESIQSWHLWRRRYNLFLNANVETNEEFDQFGAIDAPFLSFQFPVQDSEGYVNGAVDRNWVGLGRELFTDTGVYIMRMAPASFIGLEQEYPALGPGLSLDQRLVMLGTAISVDFDYFSRHSDGRGFGVFPFFGGGEPFVEDQDSIGDDELF